MILASGGTTGTPKGVVGQHKAYVYTGLQLYTWNKAEFDAGNDVILVPLPVFHVYANVGAFGLGLASGSPLALVPNPRDLADVLKTIKATRPAFMLSVPTLFQAMLNSPVVRAGKVDFSSIKISFSGAMALMKATKEQFEALTGGRIIEGYSLTEGMMACLVNPLRGRAKIGSIGVPLPDVDARIVDVETGLRELGPGDEGELLLRAPQLMREYWNNAAETAQALRADAEGDVWLHTGDIGYMDEDGYVFLTDRKKDLIKPGGYQVWPREVEEVLAGHPAIAEVGVAGVPDTARGEAVKAWVVLRAGQSATAEELQRLCKEKLAPYKVPSAIEFRTGAAQDDGRQDPAPRAGPSAHQRGVAAGRAALRRRIVGAANRPSSAACATSHRRKLRRAGGDHHVLARVDRPSAARPCPPSPAVRAARSSGPPARASSPSSSRR